MAGPTEGAVDEDLTRARVEQLKDLIEQDRFVAAGGQWHRAKRRGAKLRLQTGFPSGKIGSADVLPAQLSRGKSVCERDGLIRASAVSFPKLTRIPVRTTRIAGANPLTARAAIRRVGRPFPGFPGSRPHP